MKYTRPLFSKRAVLPLLLGAALAGANLCCPLRSPAQDAAGPSAAPGQQAPAAPADNATAPADNSGAPAGQDQTNPAQNANLNSTLPAPANPLIIADPRNQAGNPTVYYDRNGNQKPEEMPSSGAPNYKQDTANAPAAQKKPLPLFGYDFFLPTRQIIQARRAYLRRRYETNMPAGSFSAPAATTGDRQNLRRSRGNASQPDQTYVPSESLPAEPMPARRNGSDTVLPGDSGQDTGAQGLSGTDAAILGAGAAARGMGSISAADKSRNKTLPGALGDVSGGTSAFDNTAQSELPGESNNPAGPYGSMPPLNEARGQSGLAPSNGQNGGYYYGGAGSLYPDNYNSGYYNGGYYNGAYGNGNGQQSLVPPVDSAHEVSDPLTEIYRNVAASLPASYQLSTGDILTIRYWSPTMQAREVTATVDAQDAINIEGVGRLVVRGQTAAQAEHALRQQLRRLYNGADVSITLKEPRTIPVTVSGDVFAPGTYNVPAVSTAFNVLYAAGGPTEDGTLRAVEVLRGGRVVGTLDVYKLLIGGSPFKDITLQPGDLISVPGRISRVSVEGEVRQPAIYELTAHETLQDALRYARGVKPSGVSQHVQINTLEPGAARVLKDVNVNDAAQAASLPLYDGDVVDVFSLRSTLANRVTVEGAVDQPGDYALSPGMTVSDLLERARGPREDAYLTRADLYRWNPDTTTTLIPIDVDKALAHDPTADLSLTRWDRLKVYTRRQVAWTGNRDVTVRGAVQRPGVYYRSQNMHVEDLLLAAGGPMPEASLGRAVLLHQKPDGSFGYDYINIAEALQGDQSQNVALQDNDILAIYHAGEAQFTPDHVVTVRGDVVAPGIYPRGDGMHLSDLIKLAGGFRPGAGSTVTVAHAYQALDSPKARLASKTATLDSQGNAAPGEDVVLKDGDVVTVQGTGGFQDHVSVVTIKGAVNRPGPIAMTSRMRLSDALRAAGGLQPEAFPQGAEFTRSSDKMATAGQRSLAQIISKLNDLLNQSAYKRELAKSDLERIKGAQDASQGSAPLLPIGGASLPAAPSPAAAALSTQLSQHALVSPARALAGDDLTPNGNIAVNLQEAMRHPNGPEDIMLMDGDTITVPEQPTTIQVVGAVFNGRGVLFKPGAPLSYYVAQAGGFAPDAASDRIEIIHAGGGLIPADKVRSLQPGDLILVPTRVLAEKLQRGGNRFEDFFRSLTSSAIVYKVATGLFGL